MLYARSRRAASINTPRMRHAAHRLSRAPSQNHLTALTSRDRTIDTARADTSGAPQNRQLHLWASQLEDQRGRKGARLARATSELLRAEARYRGNEAAYLPDALAEAPWS